MASAKTTLTRPASARFVLITLLLALLLNLLPWSSQVKQLWPDCIALLLLYWAIHQPREIGLGAAWFLGLVMDIADGVLFGQHALAYTLMIFLAQILRPRIQMFSFWQQALYIFGLLLIALVIMLVTRLAFGAAFPGPLYFGSSVLGALLWPSLSMVMRIPQHRKPRADDTFTKLANK